jgi:hypothetical protein
MPLPHAKTIGVEAIKSNETSIAHHKKKIEQWIDNKIIPLLKHYMPEVDFKKRLVKGCVTEQCPNEYYGCDGITNEMWKEIYESIIRPFGYEPVYTHDGGGMYSVVGIKWETPL